MRYGYPTIIRDNFFSHPNKIVEFANSLEYHPQAIGQWPGKRTYSLETIDPNFYHAMCRRILKNYYTFDPESYRFKLYFQKSLPYVEEQYNPRNLGWPHVDSEVFGGLVFLTENPEKNTGTSLFDLENFYFNYPNHVRQVKQRNYLRDENLTDDEYIGAYEFLISQFKETLDVQSKYNRLLSFDGNQFHALQSIGTKERLTLVFFCEQLTIDEKEIYHGHRLFD